MSELTGVVIIRPARYGDRAYCLRTWLSSYCHSPVARALGHQFYRAWAGVVEEQYDKSEVRIACLKEDPDVIVGFAVVSGANSQHDIQFDAWVHYVCVRDRWRRKGVAKLLLGELVNKVKVGYTHSLHPTLKEIVPAGWVYEPTLTHRWLDK